jgi:Pyridoxamine 5'-phosphate oxidase
MGAAMITREEVLAFMRRYKFAVEASVHESGGPQAALVGIAVTDRFEIVFDSFERTRKLKNLRKNPRVAFVIGGWNEAEGERTVQFEGLADEPQGAELERVQQFFFRNFADSPEKRAWEGLVYVRCRPTWIRYSDFDQDPAEIVEFDFSA